MDRSNISDALKALQKGGLVVYPTDTLYALGADVSMESAVREVFTVKQRPLDVPLPVAVADIGGMEKVAFVDERVKRLAERFLPGPLTFLLRKKDVPDIVTSGLEKIAVRIPNHEIALELLETFGPLTVTSANIHGQETPSSIPDIKEAFPPAAIDVFLDEGRLTGEPSTIVDLTLGKPTIVREGKISEREILEVM
jgi:L-threonylcarbamoyladenylate synthase